MMCMRMIRILLVDSVLVCNILCSRHRLLLFLLCFRLICFVLDLCKTALSYFFCWMICCFPSSHFLFRLFVPPSVLVDPCLWYLFEAIRGRGVMRSFILTLFSGHDARMRTVPGSAWLKNSQRGRLLLRYMLALFFSASCLERCRSSCSYFWWDIIHSVCWQYFGQVLSIDRLPRWWFYCEIFVWGWVRKP